MADTTLSFAAKNSTGNNLGDYEQFLDLAQGTNTITLLPPTGWSVKGIKIYTLTVNPAGKLMPCAQKNQDIATCRQGNFNDVFDSPGNPPQFQLSGNVLTDRNNVTTATLYAYLIWIQDGSGSNDYIDPGMRNL